MYEQAEVIAFLLVSQLFAAVVRWHGDSHRLVAGVARVVLGAVHDSVHPPRAPMPRVTL